MKEIAANRHAWSQLSKDHYETFQKSLLAGTLRLNPYILEEIGDVQGKRLIHLQCNTGADSILLEKMGAKVVGVDFVPENIHYARKLAANVGARNISFLQSDIMELADIHKERYDLVFTSEGAIGWLPDLKRWASTIRELLCDDGVFYVFDSHPFYMTMDEVAFAQGALDAKYPYFSTEPDVEESIGGYAAERRGGVQAYFWTHKVSDIINSLTAAGLHIEYFHEFAENFWDAGGMRPVGSTGLYQYDFNKDCIPMSFSLKATIYCR